MDGISPVWRLSLYQGIAVVREKAEPGFDKRQLG
jgi:hypothetical protein